MNWIKKILKRRSAIKAAPPATDYTFKYPKTRRFLAERYRVNNRAGHRLTVGDVCWCHPTETSQSREKFQATIVELEIKWGFAGPSMELCTFVKGGYGAVLNDYLFSRLEFISHEPATNEFQPIK